MKRLFFYLLVAVLSAVSVISCSMYDDTLIWEKLNDHEQRLSELETLCDKLNSDVETMQKIVEALQNNDYITSVTPIYEGDKLIGYTILFAKSGPITIYNGADGKDGADGEDGQDGSNGQDGKDGHTPVIGVKMDTDGFYYWTVDGEWLLDENGQKVRVTGNDGKDGEDGEDGADGANGEDGKDGQDGHTPTIGVKEDGDGILYWTIDGEWLLDENGNKVPVTGKDGEDGSDGASGSDGDSFFSGVDTSDPNYVVITLADGSEIKIPTWFAFENLQNTVNQINNNVQALQKIVEALQNNDFVTSVSPIYEDDEVIGYTIIFSKSGAVTIFNGQDGKDGLNGSNGQDGTNGTDGHTPVIGVRQDTDGVYYWTIDGEWLLDENGNKLRVTGRDGQDGSDGSNGSNGQDGADGHTPVIGVKQYTDGVYYWTVDGEWLLDENGNKVPTTGRDGADGSNGADGSDGQDGDSFFSSVDTSDSNYVIITLSDGTEIKLPTWKAFEELQNTVNQINNNVNALQQIVEALQNNDYVTSVTPIYEGGNVVGYTIIFSKSGAVSIFNGKDGLNGSNGQDGTNGADGHTPVIGVRQDTDGVYYWTVDGEWLLDENGNKLRVTGRDGQDGSNGSNGSNGQDGADGHTPVIGVKQDTDGVYYWTVDGEWLLDENGNKVPTTGRDGADGSNGSDGEDGQDGDSFFSSVDTSDSNYVIITLSDGTEIKLPTWKAFEDLQNTVNQINNNVNALQQIVEALQNNDYVTSVTPIYEGGNVVGYTIIFSKSGAVSIFNGKDGLNGSNGQDGTNGADGHTPVIGVRQDIDGVYYWTVDGEWLLNENGNKLRVTGRDGQDGSDGSNGSNGQDGADGHTPVIGVKQDTDGVYYWTVDGEWLLDENGNKLPTTGRDGADGSNGADGSDGQDGDSFFSSVDTSDSNYVIITLSDGTEIKLPTWKAFEDLQNTVNQINNNVNSLQQIVEALQNNDYVTSVTPIYEGGNVVGYTIIFSKSGAVSIFNGKDGQNGSNGQDGTNGTDGHTPVIGVRQDSDGVYYWTVDGEWLLDENGNKLRVTGRDGSNGSNGSNGQDGADGHTPVIGVKQDTDGVYYWTVDGEWLLDENGNKVPTTGRDGADGSNGSDGQDGDSFFSSVDTSDSNYVIITLSDGTEIKLPTWKAFEDLQNTVNQINNNVNSLQQIVEALQNNDYVTSVTPIYEGGNVVGYTIIFSKSGAVSIFNGKDGLNGSNGQDGTNGADGHTPVIGVRQDTDGVYYWTIDGEWLLNENDNKLRVTGRDGSDGSNGSNGQDGADGHTPVIGVKQDTDGVYYWTVDGEWLLDENGNKVPTTGRDGADGSNGADGSDGQDGDSFFSSVTENDKYISLILADGTEIILPKYPKAPVTLTLGTVTGFTATFNGTVHQKSLDLKVTVYYSTTPDLTVYKHRGTLSHTEFPTDSFVMKLKELAANTTYYYFVEIVGNGSTSYSEISSFRTTEPDSYVDWGDGENVGGEI